MILIFDSFLIHDFFHSIGEHQEHSQEGVYEMDEGDRVIYDLNSDAQIDSIEEENTNESCFRAHQKNIEIILLTVIIIGIKTGVGVNFGLLETSANNKK